MTRAKKIIKKKLKEPDEFINLTERAYLSVTHHSKSIATGGMIVLILLLTIFFYQRWEKKNEGNGYQLFSLATEAYQIVSAPYRRDLSKNIKMS